jgi:colanic acid biosynthesis glycosyl transferase WcaI
VRILLLNQYYPPDTAATATMAQRVARALAARHQVTVLAGRPSYDPLERHRWYLRRRFTDGSVQVVRVGSTACSRRKMIGRLANYITYAIAVFLEALRPPADAVLCMTDPPFLPILASWVARLRGRPLVYNIRDLYPDMAVGGGIVERSFWVRWWERLHAGALRRAAGVIVLGDDMRERILARGVPAERVEVVRDGAVPASAEPSAAVRERVAARVRDRWPFVAVHAGNLGFYGCWETLLGAARNVAHEGISLVFVGDGARREIVEQFAGDCPAIRRLPFFPAAEVPAMMAAADVHIVCLRRGLEGVVVPSKLYGILAAGQAVLAVVPEQSDVARIVRRYGCGLVADPDAPEDVARALRWLRAHPAELTRMRQRAAQAAADFDQHRQLEHFVRTVERVAADRRAAGTQPTAAGFSTAGPGERF